MRRFVKPGDVVVLKTRKGYSLARIDVRKFSCALTEDRFAVPLESKTLQAIRSPLPEVES